MGVVPLGCSAIEDRPFAIPGVWAGRRMSSEARPLISTGGSLNGSPLMLDCAEGVAVDAGVEFLLTNCSNRDRRDETDLYMLLAGCHG